VATATTVPPIAPAAVATAHACGESGGTLIEAEAFNWFNFEPAYYVSHTDRRVMRSMYDSLLDIDSENRLIPKLATSWELQPNGKDYIFTLRDDVTFHDGAKFDAQVVADQLYFNMNDPGSIVAPEVPNFAGETEIIDPYTIKAVLTSTSSPFLYGMYDAPGMMPSPEALAELGRDIGKTPVGSGAYKFVSWTPNVEVHVEKNADYWETGLPCFDEVKIIQIPESSARLAALRTGEIHIANWLAASDWERLQTMEGVKAHQFVNGARLRYVNINHESTLGSIKEFRAAIALAVDREVFWKAFSFSTGTIGYQPYYPFHHAHTPGFQYERDIERAKELIASTGLSEDELKFDWFMVSSEEEPGLLVIQENLREIGINFDIVRVDSATNSQMRKDNELTIQLSGWSTRPHPDMYLWSMRHSLSNWNKQSARVSDPEVDRLLDLARATTDLDAQREVYLELAEHFVETGSHITLMYDAAIVGMADNLVGYQFAADALTRYGNFPFWLE
jgi:peptide/nickel transport system substrate-binding protein